MKEKFQDSRLQVWPPVYREGDALELQVCVFTPLRFAIVRFWILGPFVGVWKFFACLFILDGLATWAKVWTIFIYNPELSRTAVYTVMIALAIAYKAEVMSGYKVMRFVFGKRLRIRRSAGQVKFGSKRKLEDLPSEHGVTFTMRPLHSTGGEEILSQSRSITAVLGDSSFSEIVEVIGERNAELIVTNANLMMSLDAMPYGDDVDRDPSRTIDI